MATDLIKNERLQTGCMGSLFFNPYVTESSLMIAKDGVYKESGYVYAHTLTTSGTPYHDSSVSDYSLISFGGQFVGYTFEEEIASVWLTRILLPASTYDYLTGVDISDMIRIYDTVQIYKPIYTYGNSNPSGYAYSKMGDSNIGTNSNTDETNSIGSVRIMNVDIIRNEATYGHHSLTYNSKATYKVRLRLPYNTPIYKIQQLLQSNGIVFMYDNRIVYNDYNLPSTEYNVQKPLGGGSINPIANKVSIITGSLKETYRRNTYEIDVIFEG